MWKHFPVSTSEVGDAIAFWDVRRNSRPTEVVAMLCEDKSDQWSLIERSGSKCSLIKAIASVQIVVYDVRECVDRSFSMQAVALWEEPRLHSSTRIATQAPAARYSA